MHFTINYCHGLLKHTTVAIILILSTSILVRPSIVYHTYAFCTNLKHMGLLLLWLRNFLNGRKQCVVLNNAQSNWSTVTSGVPQGSVLGPLLFAIFVNDIPHITKSILFLFANDIKLSQSINAHKTLKFFKITKSFWLVNCKCFWYSSAYVAIDKFLQTLAHNEFFFYLTVPTMLWLKCLFLVNHCLLVY